MSNLSNPFSTGGGGTHFEVRVQASFVALMLTGGFAPCLSNGRIAEIMLQAKKDGFQTDDMIVVVQEEHSKEERKMLCQIKHRVCFNSSDENLPNILQAAWQDFNNPKLFSKSRDLIVLITGPLTQVDFENVLWLLRQARNSKNATDFFNRVSLANFSPRKSEEKLEVIKTLLKSANNDVDVPDGDLFSFLQHFRLLGYDFDEEKGVVLSLIESHISLFNRTIPHEIWTEIVDYVMHKDENSGSIILENIPEYIKRKFVSRQVEHIPKELIPDKPSSFAYCLNNESKNYAPILAKLTLVGGWYDKSEKDVEVVSSITGEPYNTVAQNAGEILHLPDTPLSLLNGHWIVSNRNDLWSILGSRIYDQTLNNFRDKAGEVLKERNPSFELPKEERFAASVYEKEMLFSQTVRKGIAEGLALLGNKHAVLTHCSIGKAEATATLVVREIFAESDWVLWGSLSDLLPILAEASPNEFLNAVEKALMAEPCPFDELFSQEGDGITGTNYLSGLLWALECLAWDEQFLVRVCDILGELSIHDPGGNWSNRPSNSLTTIFLPWLPQTIASVEKRVIAIQKLCEEWPDIAWKLLVSLLPSQHQVSLGTYKPKWRMTIPENKEKKINIEGYWQQVGQYAELAVSMAEDDYIKLGELIDHLEKLPKASFERVLEILSSDMIIKLPDIERLPLWEKLLKLEMNHRRFPDANWSKDEEILMAIEKIAEKLIPSDPLYRYQHLFTWDDFELCMDYEEWEEQQSKIAARRQDAISEIMSLYGLEGVLSFAGIVKNSRQVGYSLACIVAEDIDRELLPSALSSAEHRLIEIVRGFIWGRFSTRGWTWVDQMDKTEWASESKVQFLISLPFTEKTWERANSWLGTSKGEYWRVCFVNPYHAEGDLAKAVEELISTGRPRAAVYCLYEIYHGKQPIDVGQCLRALSDAVSSPEPVTSTFYHHVVELIKNLQAISEVTSKDLIKIELAYLRLLDGHYGVTPKTIESALASNPEFFCQVLQLIYRPKDKASGLSDEKKAVAENAWHLLFYWRTPPGMQEDGSIDEDLFDKWLQRVKEICSSSGHLEVAMITIGGVLIYCPEDKSGLWINKTVAEALDARDAEDMRGGFVTGIYNSRGVQWVDPTGAPEKALAEKYRKRAEELDNAGLPRFAATMRKLSDSYLHEAERIIVEHKEKN